MYENTTDVLKHQDLIRKRLLNYIIDYNVDVKAISRESKINYSTLLKYIRGSDIAPITLLRVDRFLTLNEKLIQELNNE